MSTNISQPVVYQVYTEFDHKLDIIFVVIRLLITLIIISCNSFLIYTISNEKKFRTNTFRLLGYQAYSDLTIGLGAFFQTFVCHDHWVKVCDYCLIQCEWSQILTMSGVCTSSWFLSFICYDRFQSLYFPLSRNSQLNVRVVGIFTWIYCLSCLFLYQVNTELLTFFGDNGFYGCQLSFSSLTTNWFFAQKWNQVVGVAAISVPPTVSIGVLSGAIIVKIRQMKPVGAHIEQQYERSYRRKMKISRMIFTITSAYYTLTSAAVVYYVLCEFKVISTLSCDMGSTNQRPSIVFHIVSFIVMSSGVSNTIILICYNRTFRNQANDIKSFICCQWISFFCFGK